MNIAFIGIGKVGYSLANNLEKAGHKIIIGTNRAESKSAVEAKTSNPGFTITDIQNAVDSSEIIFLATPFFAAESVLKDIRFNGKTLIDCTNPVGPGITHGLKSEISGSEKIQSFANDAKVVKAFTIYGYENFADSSFPKYEIKPAMLIAGDYSEAKKQASSIIEDLGFFPKDTGALSQSLHLEHMTLLWVKMVRANGHHPNFVWAYMEK